MPCTFSIIVWAHDTNEVFYRDMLESLVQQNYDNFEVYILDEAYDDYYGRVLTEFFPENPDVHYRKLKKNTGGAYAYNIGAHFATCDYVVFLGQHDRISPGTLYDLSAHINNNHGLCDLIYTDHAEIHGLNVEKPHFKGGFNKELLLRTNYIGDFIVVKNDALRRIGDFNEKLKYAYVYEYIFRCAYKGLKIYNVPSMLYFRRMEAIILTKEVRKQQLKIYREYISVVKAQTRLLETNAEVIEDKKQRFLTLKYSSEGFKRNGKDYILMRDDDVRLLTKKAPQIMYGYLQAKDVAVVGIRFLSKAFTIDNIGYIYDEAGNIYPAFHGHKIYQESYERLDTFPRDVSMVDPGYCMLDAKIYRYLGGMDANLTGREAMLDYCLRAIEAGFRVVVAPELVGRYNAKEIISSEQSHDMFMKKHFLDIKKGDKYYSPNLVMGMQNYILVGENDESGSGNGPVNINESLSGPSGTITVTTAPDPYGTANVTPEPEGSYVEPGMFFDNLDSTPK